MTCRKKDQEKKLTIHDPNYGDKLGSLKERLATLKRGRTNKETAAAWDIPLSTLTGYINRGSMLPADTALLIAERENVSIQWLITGKGTPDAIETLHAQKEEPTSKSFDDTVLTGMPPEDKHKLVQRILLKGVNSLDLSEAQDRWAALVADLSVEAEREIYPFAKKAKYMWLAGVPFSTPADIEQWDEKRA